jgi:hypothetical protein
MAGCSVTKNTETVVVSATWAGDFNSPMTLSASCESYSDREIYAVCTAGWPQFAQPYRT